MIGLGPEEGDPAVSIQELQDEVTRLQGQVDTARLAQEEADRKAAEAVAAAAAAMATKLYAGIGTDNRSAAYGTGDNADDIAVVIGTSDAVNLSEDTKATVAARHGWEGKKYMASGAGVDGTYEAVVYSNIGDPTPGMAFEKQYTGTFAGGILNEATTEGDDTKVASDQFDQSAGVKEFLKGENREYVEISGSFHGVSGTYRCDPGSTDGTNCAVSVAAKGFTLGAASGAEGEPRTFAADGGEWTFKPADPKAMVMSSSDGDYASYGWWIHKSADDKTYTAGAFTANKGDTPTALTLTDLKGEATYIGGAAGKYALKSSTGGTNDAGHFTAMAMLKADFTADMISGTIDSFMGADGEMRDWSVELKKTEIDNAGAGTAADTIWTIGDMTASNKGSWTGSLQEQGQDGVPMVATGTFTSKFNGDGEMVGAFGANKQ